MSLSPVLLLAVGARFQVQVEDMAGAGYLWQVHPDSASGVTLVDAGLVLADEVLERHREARAIGGPSLRTLTFEVKTVGDHALVLHHSRPWMAPQPADQYYRLTVRGVPAAST
jgi:predicted secreted protein